MQADRITAESPGSNVFLKGGIAVKPKAARVAPPLPGLFPPTSLKSERPVERAFDVAGAFTKRPKNTPSFGSIGPVLGGAFMNAAEHQDPPGNPLPAGTNLNGEDMVRMGEADHRANHELYANPPSSEAERAKGPNPTSSFQILGELLEKGGGEPFPKRPGAQNALEPGESYVGHFGKDLVGYGLTGANVFMDTNTRLANLRRDYANDPTTEADDPKYEWTTPKGNTYTDDQIRSAWMIQDKIWTDEDLEKAEVIGYSLVDPSDPMAEYKTLGKDAQGRPWTATGFKMPGPDGVVPAGPTGTVISLEERNNAQLAYSYFPDDGGKGVHTIKEYGDGRVPDEVKGRIGKRQINANAFGVAEPRYPWQDTAGNSPLLDKEWDPTRLVGVGEGLASSADLFLGSAPFSNFGKKYRYLSAASQSIPSLMGYDTNSYESSGRGFENPGALGTGRMKKGDLTWAQRIAGGIGPWVDQWAENWGGKAIGINEGGFIGRKLAGTKAGDVLMHTPHGRIGAAVAGELFEEGPPTPFGVAQRDSLKDFGRESRWNPETGKVEYYARGRPRSRRNFPTA
jgi:hypothetical protein